MRRRLFTFASVLSLLLLVGFTTLWVRSYWVTDQLRWETSTGSVVVLASSVDRFQFSTWQSDNPTGHSTWTYTRWEGRRTPMLFASSEYDPSVLAQFGFHYNRQADTTDLMLPLWLLSLISGVLPVIWFRTRRRSGTRAACTTCDYNLTGNTSGTCPECGTVIPRGPEAGV